MIKKLLSILMCLTGLLVANHISAQDWSQSASAAVETTDYDIDGTSIAVYTNIGMAWVADVVNNPDNYTALGITPGFEGYTINLENDLMDLYEFSSLEWVPIGYNGKIFNGKFDGKGHTVSGVWIDRAGIDNIGFFGQISTSAKIENLLVGIDEKGITGETKVGGLVGASKGDVTRCGVFGGKVSGKNSVGGLIGDVQEGTPTGIFKSYASCDVSGSGNYIGGLIGYFYVNVIDECYSTGNVSATGESSIDVGGLIGYSTGSEITNSYSISTVQNQNTGENYSGSFIGVYVNSNTPRSMQNCYIDGDNNTGMPGVGSYSTGSGEGNTLFSLTSSQMKSASSFAGFDFSEDAWAIEEGLDLPYLKQVSRFAGGNGEEQTPFLVRTARQLNQLRDYLDESFYFKQTGDIDLTEFLGNSGDATNRGWIPIGCYQRGDDYGDSYSFSGYYDGGGYTVSGLWIRYDSRILPEKEREYSLGLFGYSYGTISNLNVVIAEPGITVWDEIGGAHMLVGGLVGESNEVVQNCSVSSSGGKITVSCKEKFVGGLMGFSWEDVSGSFAEIDIIADVIDPLTSSSTNSVGGLIGETWGGDVKNSYAKGSIRTKGDKYAVGGLIGNNSRDTYNSYAVVDIQASGDEIMLGGLFGYSGESMTHCYAAGHLQIEEPTTDSYIGGLIGESSSGSPIYDGCFYDIETTGENLDAIGNTPGVIPGTYGLSTAELMQQQTFEDNSYVGDNPWLFITDVPDVDNDIVWNIEEGKKYPYLWFSPQKTEPIPPSVTYHTVILETASGIELYGISPGKLTVEEGSNLFLQFLPDDRSLTSGDVLFLVDGAATAFKDLGGSYYYVYTLSDIRSGHTILIALKEYPVVLPDIKEGHFDVGPGSHAVSYGEPFRFALTLNEGQNPADVTILVNGIILEPESREDMTLTFLIDAVTGPLDITVEGLDPTGNATVHNPFNIYTTDGILVVETVSPTRVSVYSVTGQLCNSSLINGRKDILLSEGIYFVRVNGDVYKVIVK